MPTSSSTTGRATSGSARRGAVGITAATLSDVLGRRFSLAELEPALSAFAGRMRGGDDEIVWYLERED